jgi:hypothetical protein
MNMKYIVTVFLLIQCGKVIACDCKTTNLKQAQEFGYESSLIFIGDVLSVDKEAGTYSFDVVEVLKGKTSSKIVKGRIHTSCSGYPDQGRWIIYADIFDEEVIDFSSCGPSRSFHNPERINAKEYVILPPKDVAESGFSVDAQILFERRVLAMKSKALDDLELEIADLRKRR